MLDSGDQISRALTGAAATALAEIVSSVHRRLGSPPGLPVLLAGGLLTHHDGLAAATLLAIKSAVPAVQPRVATQPPVAGAVQLALQAVAARGTSPLAGRRHRPSATLSTPGRARVPPWPTGWQWWRTMLLLVSPRCWSASWKRPPAGVYGAMRWARAARTVWSGWRVPARDALGPATERGDRHRWRTRYRGSGGDAGAESYRLRVSDAGVEIVAPSPAGVFYGTRTLRQLLPAPLLRSAPAGLTTPTCQGWRRGGLNWRASRSRTAPVSLGAGSTSTWPATSSPSASCCG